MSGQEEIGPAMSGQSPTPTPAERSALARLKKNAQFRNVAKGARRHSRSFSLLAVHRREPGPQGPRIGFTVTRKTGSAVERNRMRRRIKEALRRAPDLCAAPDHDYVLIIRRETLSTPFVELVSELTRAFHEIASRKGRRTPAAEQRPTKRPAS